ncbi:MAG: ABC transporter ATP-binding protein [Candidatus Bathyarchaeia archaeon]
MSDSPLLKVNDLRMYYSVEGGWVKAVDGLILDVYKNECVGVVGESGCGKSSLALTIIRVLPANSRIFSGEILFEGENILGLSEEDFRKRIRWKKISIVFQGAMNSLNPVITIGDQIVETILAHENVSKKEAWERAENLLRLVGIDPKRAKSYPFEFSGGMKQRAMIAMALALNPSLLIADEMTTALDVIIQAQIINLVADLRRRLNLSSIIISHDIPLVFSSSDRIFVMYAGKIVEYGSTEEIYYSPMHPYTFLLLDSVPDIRGKRRTLGFIEGAPPNLLDPPTGCRFHPRCPFAVDICRKEEPEMSAVSSSHHVACHRLEEITLKRALKWAS